MLPLSVIKIYNFLTNLINMNSFAWKWECCFTECFIKIYIFCFLQKKKCVKKCVFLKNEIYVLFFCLFLPLFSTTFLCVSLFLPFGKTTTNDYSATEGADSHPASGDEGLPDDGQIGQGKLLFFPSSAFTLINYFIPSSQHINTLLIYHLMIYFNGIASHQWNGILLYPRNFNIIGMWGEVVNESFLPSFVFV